MPVEPFPSACLQAIADVLGDTNDGFSGSDIGRLLQQCGIPDAQDVSTTKRHRLFAALERQQTRDRSGNNVVRLIHEAMNPARHHSNEEWFRDTQLKLNRVLVFHGMRLGDDGRLIRVAAARTHSEARNRTAKLRESLLARNVHADVLRFCREELLVDNYFHAVFEATKSVAEKIRDRTGLSSDGGSLVDEAFSFKNALPHIAINKLATESEQSEQKGFANLLKGLFGTFRNTTAHAPKIAWVMTEQDALDILSLVSLLHRRLDDSACPRKLGA